MTNEMPKASVIKPAKPFDNHRVYAPKIMSAGDGSYKINSGNMFSFTIAMVGQDEQITANFIASAINEKLRREF